MSTRKSANADTQFGKIRDAKGYYNEGDKKYKILKEEYLGPMKQTLFKAYFLFLLIMQYPVELHYKSIKDW